MLARIRANTANATKITPPAQGLCMKRWCFSWRTKKFRLRLKVTALVIIRCRIDKITPLQNGKMSEPYRKQDTKTSYLPLRNAKLHSL